MGDELKVDIIVTSNNNSEFNPQLLISNLSEYQLNFSKLCYEQKSTDVDKIENLKRAITSDSDVILAMRGGSGATRLMDKLKELPKLSKPKTFVGYSDLTVLLNYLNKDKLFTCIHGPMASKLTSPKQTEKFRAAINHRDVIFKKEASWLVAGQLQGCVVGGNLLLTVNSIGTFYQPEFKDKILLIEEIDEPIEKIDRMFAQLRDSNILKEVRGIILGNFNNCGDQEELNKLFEFYFGCLNIPVLCNLNLGHIEDSDYIYLHTELRIDESGIYYD